MKVLCNGGLNCSELDGWWAEAYAPEVGWAIGDGREHDGDPEAEAADAEALYRLLENEIVPQFYERDEGGVPHAWVAKIRASMTLLTPQFSSNRMLREYTTQYYEPAAAAYRKRLAGGARLGREIQEWRSALEAHWDEVALGALHVEQTPNGYEFRILASFGAIDPSSVRVELYAEPRDAPGSPERIPMQRGEPIDHVAIAYTATIGPGESPERYTPRVVPFHPDASVPLEASGIRWQH
jgi:starch phosphorylase